MCGNLELNMLYLCTCNENSGVLTKLPNNNCDRRKEKACIQRTEITVEPSSWLVLGPDRC